MAPLGLPRWLWGVLFGLGLALRLAFVVHQPFTNDEGSYLYDAATLLDGRLPAGDVLAKAPTAALAYAASVWLTSHSLYAARIVGALANLLTAIPLGVLAARLGSPTTGRWSVLLWLFGAGPVVFSAFGQTEALAALFGTSGLALWARALGVNGPRRAAATAAAAAGLALLLAFGSRKTAVVLLVPALLLALWAPHERLGRALRWAAAGALPLLGLWLIWMSRLYGAIGLQEALGLGYFEILRGHVTTPEVVRSWAGSPLWALTVGLRVAGPLLLLAAIGLVAAFRQRFLRRPVGLAAGWFSALAALYAAWPTLLPDYLPEFFPSVVILAAVGAVAPPRVLAWRGAGVVGLLLLAWNLAILPSVARHPWFGMFTAGALREAAAELRARVPADEPVFTAALLVPYLSGHRVFFDIAHPFWYPYAFITDEKLKTFLPPLAEVEDAVRGRVRWALVEHFTDWAYLRHPSDLLSVLRKEFRLVREVPNDTGYRNNPLRLFRRE